MVNPFYLLFATTRSFGPFVLRMTLAVIFFVHGTQKAFGWFGGAGWAATIENFTDSNSIGLPYVVAAAVILGEIVIAAGLLVGFLTRLAALGVMAIMLGAIYFVHYREGLGDVELPLTLLFVALSLFLLGGGRLSIDRAISSLLLPTVG